MDGIIRLLQPYKAKLLVRVEIPGGMRLDTAIQKGLELAKRLGCIVVFAFRADYPNIDVYCDTDYSAADIEAQFNDALEADVNYQQWQEKRMKGAVNNE